MPIFFCSKCNQPVGFLYEDTIRRMDDKGVAEFVQQHAEDGRLVVFYPPPEGPCACPRCGTILEDF